ncbi:MAG TPA: class D sortase [Candidatus Saccharimonadales bacterium]
MVKKKKKSNKKELVGSRVKLTFRRHFLPPLVGLAVAISVFGFFNSQLISGKIAYYLYGRNANTSELDQRVASSSVDKNAPPRILINKINVKAPIVMDQTTVNQVAFQVALRRGVVHYPNTALPGQQGNVVIFGHSSGQWWAPGDYKFVFTLLDKLTLDNKIFIEYQGVRYIYRVYDITVVEPTNLSVLNQGSNNILTLITCTPVGTSSKRLIVKAQQIVPEVSYATTATTAARLPALAHGNLPSNSSSFWQDLRELLGRIF